MGFRIGTPYWAKDGTFTAGGAQANFPATNMQNARVYSTWRSTDATTANTKYDIDLGASKAIEAVWVVGCNAADDATWQIKASDSATFPGDPGDHDSGSISVWATQVTIHESATPPWGKTAAHLLGSVVTRRYVRVEIDDTTSNTDGYVEIAVAEVSGLWAPGRAHVFGQPLSDKEVGPKDHPRHARTRAFRFRGMTEAEGFSMLGIGYNLSRDQAALFIPQHERTDLVQHDWIYAELSARPVVTPMLYDGAATIFSGNMRTKEVSE